MATRVWSRLWKELLHARLLSSAAPGLRGQSSSVFPRSNPGKCGKAQDYLLWLGSGCAEGLWVFLYGEEVLGAFGKADALCAPGAAEPVP